MKHSTYTSYDELPLMLSVTEVAAVLGISRAGAYELVHGNEFPALKIGSRIVVPKDKFLAWIDEQRFKNRTAVTKEQTLNFLCANEAAEQNREAHQCGERNSNGITQPSGAATPRNSDAHERIAVPQAFCVLREHTRPRPKSGKVCRSDTRPGDVRERAECSEGSDTTPI